MTAQPAPDWHTSSWLNTDTPLDLAAFRGKVVVAYAFQMLCPGCVNEGIPQAKRVAALFAGAPLAVVGLHTVFQHHDVMGPAALKTFLHEFGVRFPVGIDTPAAGSDPMPLTMQAYGMRGTPTTLLIDAEGRLRRQVFGKYDDLVLGSDIGALITEAKQAGTTTSDNSA